MDPIDTSTTVARFTYRVRLVEFPQADLPEPYEGALECSYMRFRVITHGQLLRPQWQSIIDWVDASFSQRNPILYGLKPAHTKHAIAFSCAPSQHICICAGLMINCALED